MDNRNAQVGWTEAQWNRVRQEVLRAWQSVRVAGSFLSVYGPLPESTQVVPSEVLNANPSLILFKHDSPPVAHRQSCL